MPHKTNEETHKDSETEPGIWVCQSTSKYLIAFFRNRWDEYTRHCITRIHLLYMLQLFGEEFNLLLCVGDRSM